MTCPLNGPRKASEFVRGREVKEVPESLTCSNRASGAHGFLKDHDDDEVAEWWMHAPTSYWFIARRNKATEEIVKTYTVEEFFGLSERAGVDKLAA
ncbi:MAG: sarcosine oxidase subunit delta [Alphaproteobacteria bacterium]